MEEKNQELREETSDIVVLDPGIELTDVDIESICCAISLFPYRSV
ncbi:MAG: hypothetical protein V2B19_13605 [Pseudomonadota bacterium]